MNSFISVLLDIVKTPAILVAIISLVGLLLQKKSTTDIVKGTVKTFIGFLVLTAGAGVVQGSLEPFGGMFQAAFNVTGVVPNNEAIISMALLQFGTTSALIMFFGMLVNILIARLTKFKHIFLTGHHTLYMACMLAVIFHVAGFEGITLIIVGSLALGSIMSLAPFILQTFMNDMTGTNSVGLGHFGSLGYALSGYAGRLIRGKKDKVVSTEDVNFPKSLAFLRDSTVAIALTMMVIYIIVAIIAGPDFVNKQYPKGGNFIIFALTKGGEFAAGVFVILQGVRLILNEIVPAFKGISEKLVPNSIPALDCPIVFTFAPNAVLIGFFASFVGGIISLVVMGLLKTVIILPGVVPHFFCGATAGVFGNSKGGLKGCILGAFIHGILISFLPIFLMPLLGNLGFANATFSDADFCAAGIFYGGLAGIGAKLAVILGLILVYVLMIVYSVMKKENEVNVN